MQSWAAHGRPRSSSRRQLAPRDHLVPWRRPLEPGPPCPHCHRRAAADEGPFCPYCGRYLAPLQWVAEPPPGALPPPGRVRAPLRRTAALPRRCPAGASRRGRGRLPRPAAGRSPVPLAAARSAGRHPGPAALGHGRGRPAGGGRRGLALRRCSWPAATGRCPPAWSPHPTPWWSSAGTVAPILAADRGGLLVLWTVRASRAAADGAGVAPVALTPGDRARLAGSARPEPLRAGVGAGRDRAHRAGPAGAAAAPARRGCCSSGGCCGSRAWCSRPSCWLVAAWRGAGARGRRACCTRCWTWSPPRRPSSPRVLVIRLTQLLGPPRVRRREILVSVENEPAVIDEAVRSPEVRSRRVTA